MKKTQEMLKVIRDGKVAVLFSPGYGVGWYTWGVPLDGVFHPELVGAVERGAKAMEIINIATRLFGNSKDHHYAGARQLVLIWINEGIEFRIEEYDGGESIIVKEKYNWITA